MSATLYGVLNKIWVQNISMWVAGKKKNKNKQT